MSNASTEERVRKLEEEIQKLQSRLFQLEQEKFIERMNAFKCGSGRYL